MDPRRREVFEQQQADITELEHAALSPFMLILSLVKWTGLLLAVLIVTVGSWAFGIFGGNGMAERQAVADHIKAVTQTNAGAAPDADWERDHIDFSQRPTPLVYTNGTLVIPASASPTFVGPYREGLRPLAGVTSSVGTSSSRLCAPGGDYDTRLGAYDKRSMDALARKSARMQAAFDNGVIMASAMRRVFAHMKLHPNQPLKSGDLVFQPGNPYSLCNADPWYPGISESEYDAQAKVSQSLHVIGPDMSVMHYHGKIVGMCAWDICSSHSDHDDLTYYVTWFTDIWANQPPLSDEQLRQVVSLNSMSTNEDWVREAHYNDIDQDDEVRRVAALVREYRNRIMWPKGKPSYAYLID